MLTADSQTQVHLWFHLSCLHVDCWFQTHVHLWFHLSCLHVDCWFPNSSTFVIPSFLSTCWLLIPNSSTFVIPSFLSTCWLLIPKLKYICDSIFLVYMLTADSKLKYICDSIFLVYMLTADSQTQVHLWFHLSCLHVDCWFQTQVHLWFHLSCLHVDCWFPNSSTFVIPSFLSTCWLLIPKLKYICDSIFLVYMLTAYGYGYGCMPRYHPTTYVILFAQYAILTVYQMRHYMERATLLHIQIYFTHWKRKMKRSSMYVCIVNVWQIFKRKSSWLFQSTNHTSYKWNSSILSRLVYLGSMNFHNSSSVYTSECKTKNVLVRTIYWNGW